MRVFSIGIVLYFSFFSAPILARYYGSINGTFISTDSFDVTMQNTNSHVSVGNPQRLNPYSYVINKPMAYIDPDGNMETSTAKLLLYGGKGLSMLNTSESVAKSYNSAMTARSTGMFAGGMFPHKQVIAKAKQYTVSIKTLKPPSLMKMGSVQDTLQKVDSMISQLQDNKKILLGTREAVKGFEAMSKNKVLYGMQAAVQKTSVPDLAADRVNAPYTKSALNRAIKATDVKLQGLNNYRHNIQQFGEAILQHNNQ